MIALTPPPDAKVNRFNPRSITPTKPAQRDLTETEVLEDIGNHKISAWRTALDTIRFQVRSPELARRIAKLDGARRVDKGGHGPFFRLYEVPRDFAWATEYVTAILSELN